MAVNNNSILIDTSYHANLRKKQQEQQQGITPINLPSENMQGQINTSYQANAGVQYGGHDASWWNEQYSSQGDDNSKAMIAKAADYYGYKIPNSLNASPMQGNNAAPTSYAANIPTMQRGAVQPQNEQGALTQAAAMTYDDASYAANMAAARQATPQAQNEETTPAPPVAGNSSGAMSYEEWLKQQANNYKDNFDKQNQFIEDQKQAAIKQAEEERQRSIIDARSSYEQNKASYGANAEALASMGLTGSGYSDYIDSQAYAAQRAENQAANVQAIQSKQNAENYANDAKMNAELSYQENMAKNDAALAEYNEQKKAVYNELLNNAMTGAYDAEQLKQLASNYGLDEAQTNQLVDAYYKANADEIKQGISSGDSASIEANIGKADRYYANGKITQAQYQGINNDYLSQAIKGVATGSDYKTMQESIEKYKNEGKITQAQYDKLVAKLKADTQKSFASTVSSGLNAHSSTVTLNTPDGKVTITYGVNSKSMKPKSGNAVFSSEIYKNAGSGQVFIVNGKPYVKLKNGDLGWVNDYLGSGACEKLYNTYKGTAYDIS